LGGFKAYQYSLALSLAIEFSIIDAITTCIISGAVIASLHNTDDRASLANQSMPMAN
jgi:hypothetical protein